MSGDGVDFFPTTFVQNTDPVVGRSQLVDSMDSSTYSNSFDDEPPLLDGATWRFFVRAALTHSVQSWASTRNTYGNALRRC